jgi:hypothetical protein
LVHRPWIFLGALQFSVLTQCSLVLRPAGSITAFQHDVTRSLRRFHVGSPGSSPCLLDHCVSTPCDSITAAVLITMWLDHCVSTPCDSITAVVPRWISRFFALLARYLTRWKYRILSLAKRKGFHQPGSTNGVRVFIIP